VIKYIRKGLIKIWHFDPLDKWYILITPALVALGFVTVYPVMYNLIQAFYSTDFSGRQHFVGLRNFGKLLTSSTFAIIMRNTLVWTVGIIVAVFLLGLVAALILNMNFKGRTFFRVVLVLPWVVPRVIAGLMWKYMVHGDLGVINDILVRLGLIDSYIPWLGNTGTSLFTVMIAQIWKLYPFVMIMLLAGLQSIPQVLYEAAQIDGANTWQKFRYITFPQLFMVVRIIILLMCVWAINAFDLVYVMSRGGPLHSSELLAMRIYTYGFEIGRFGMAAATSTVAFFITILFAIMYLKIIRVGEE